jgi:hypothetical protein
MQRLVLFFSVLCVVAQAQDEISECDVNAISGSTFLDDSAIVLQVTEATVPVTLKFDNESLSQRYRILIQGANFWINALDAQKQSVGAVKSFTAMAEADCIVFGPGSSPACTGILGCDGFVFGTVKTLQQFPQTARFFVFNFTFLVQDPESTQTVRKYFVFTEDVKVAARNLLMSEPEIVLWSPSDDLRTQAFPPAAPAATSDDFNALTIGLLGGTLGLVVLVAVACLVWQSAKKGTSTLASEEETKRLLAKEEERLVEPPPPKYEITETDRQQLDQLERIRAAQRREEEMLKQKTEALRERSRQKRAYARTAPAPLETA